MRKYCLALILIWLPLAVMASGPDIFGYFEPQYFGFVTNDEYYQLQSNKLRIDIGAQASNKVSFTSNINLINYNGMVEYNLLNYLPDRVTASIPAAQLSQYKISYKDTIFLDNAYLRITFRWGDVTVGKQQISYGSGYAWNPTNILNVKDVLDPIYEQPGQNAVRLEVPLSNYISCMGVYSPGNDFENSKALFRLKGYISRFDVGVVGAVLNQETTDFVTFTQHDEMRNMYGVDVVGQLLGLGVWLGGAYNVMETSDDYTEALIGLDYTLDNGTYWMGEYYHNSAGDDDYLEYNLNDYMRYFSGEIRSLGKHNVFLYVDHPATDLITIGSSVIYSISDAGVAIVPQVIYSMFQDVELMVMGNLYAGRSGATFNSDLGQGGLARLTVYF